VLRVESASPDDLARVHPWLDGEIQQLPETVRHPMRVALEEVVMNVARHGFAPGVSGEITICFKTSPTAATLVVEDTGRAFDSSTPPHHAPPAHLADAEPGGLGLVLLHRYCSDITWRRIGERNQLTLRFALPPV
jgi:anti-sigma regulatory factor (Ser/Thr protein kinase)